MARSDLLISPRATPTVVLQGNNWTTSGSTFAIGPMPTSAARNAAEHAHKKHNARLDDTSISPFTFMSRYDNAHGSWRKRPSSRRHNDKGRRWKRCSRNSRIRSGCAACGYDASSSLGSSSGLRQRFRTSSDWCASSASHQYRCLSATRCQRATRRSLHHTATEPCNQRLFQHPRLFTTCEWPCLLCAIPSVKIRRRDGAGHKTVVVAVVERVLPNHLSQRVDPPGEGV